MEAIRENWDSELWAHDMLISLAEWGYTALSNERSSSDVQVSDIYFY